MNTKYLPYSLVYSLVAYPLYISVHSVGKCVVPNSTNLTYKFDLDLEGI